MEEKRENDLAAHIRISLSLSFLLHLTIAVLISTSSCAKKPKYYVDGRIEAPDEESLYFQAVYDIKRGRLPEAEEKLELLIKTAEKEKRELSFHPYYDLANLKYRLKKIDDAKKYLTKAEEKMETPEDFLKIYSLWIKMGENKKGIHTLEKAIKKFPSNFRIFRVLVLNYLRWGKKEKAVEIAKEFAEKNKENPKALVIYADLLKDSGREKEAAEYYQRAISLGYYSERVILQLSGIYKKQGEIKRVIELLKDAVEKTGSLGLRIELSNILLEAGEKDEAVKYMEEVTQILSEPEVLLDFARVLLRAKKYKRAYEITKILSGKFSGKNKYILHLLKGFALSGLKRYEEAIEEFRKIPKNSEFYESAVIGQIDSLSEIDPKKAVEFGLSVTHEVLNPDIIQSIALAYRAGEEYEKALELVRKYLKKFPDNPKLLYVKAILLYEAKKFKEAAEIAGKVLEKSPDDPNYLNLKGYMLVELARISKEKSESFPEKWLEEAEKLLSEALKKRPSDPYIIDSVGWLYFIKGDIEKAEKYIKKAYELSPDDPVILEHLGDIFLIKNEIQKALELYRKGLEKKPKGYDRERIEKKVKELEEKIKSDIRRRNSKQKKIKK